MKLAILGTDADVLRLTVAAQEAGHEIIWLGDVRPDNAAAISRLASGLVDRASEWELLLDRGVADAVLVGRGMSPSDVRAEQLKRLATEAVPLLVVHPAFDSVLPYYEVDMTRRETGGTVRHYNPVAGHPILADLAKWVGDGHTAIGPIHQVTCERRLADCSRESVLRHLARDVEPLAVVAGDIRRVSAIGPSIDQISFASLQAQMTCSGLPSVRWSVGSSAGADCGLAITLVGERGTVTCFVFDVPDTDRHAPWQLETITANQDDRRALEPHDPARAAIRELEQAVMETSVARRDTMSTWESATRAMEVVDAVELSLEKGRTIDVHQQQLSERLAFRGTMAALGCGLLVLGFAVIVLVTLIGGAEGEAGQQLVPAWPLVLLAMLGFFLLLQAVPVLAQQSKKKHAEK